MPTFSVRPWTLSSVFYEMPVWTKVKGRNVHNTIRIYVKGDLNLRNTSRGRRNTSQFEFTQKVIVTSLGTLTLVHLNQYTGLIISIGREDFRLLCRNGGVAFNQRGHDTTSSFNTNRQGNNIQQQQIFCLLAGVTS
eukprot:Pompholyxophrys_punicea_v1_NODE_738_length_1374_cov_289.363912.p3 type:complete len:136 gc:universal NODE_738_length_1374_cov_289.363912:1177-770(-)